MYLKCVRVMLNDSLGDRWEKISVHLLSVQSMNGSGPKSGSPKVLDWRREVDAAKKVAGSCKQSYECHIPTSNGETRLHPGIIAQMTVYNYWMISKYTLKNILQCILRNHSWQILKHIWYFYLDCMRRVLSNASKRTASIVRSVSSWTARPS